MVHLLAHLFAISVLQDPSVATAPLETRIAFLKSKNLTKEEVDVSLARANEGSSSNDANVGGETEGNGNGVAQKMQRVYASGPPPGYGPGFGYGPGYGPGYGGYGPGGYWQGGAPPE